jgi:hypothetical protein
MGDWRYSSRHSYPPNNRWRRVLSFASVSINPRGENSQCQLHTTLVAPQEPVSTPWRREKYLAPYRESNPKFTAVQPVSSLYTELSSSIVIFVSAYKEHVCVQNCKIPSKCEFSSLENAESNLHSLHPIQF